MADAGNLHTVCCLCGDIGFPDKLFRCNKCHNRFQHSYCSSSYRESSSEAIEECEWCQSEARNSQQTTGGWSKKKMGRNDHSGLAIPKYNNTNNNSSGDQKLDQSSSSDHKAGKSPSPSPRTATRRYKLLKDVMC